MEAADLQRELVAVLREYGSRYEAEFARPFLAAVTALEHQLTREFASEIEGPVSKSHLDEFQANLRLIHVTRLYLEERLKSVQANPGDGF